MRLTSGLRVRIRGNSKARHERDKICGFGPDDMEATRAAASNSLEHGEQSSYLELCTVDA